MDGTYFVATNFRPANFYHFVHEVIARRYYLEMAEQALGMRLPVLMWNPRYPMQSLLLDHIYGDRDWHLHPAGKVLHFSRAVIARHPATPSGLCLPAFEHLRTKLRNLARGFAPRWGSRRPVYISRQDGRSASFNRKLANENELMERLAKIGFEVVLASKLDPQEQLSLYSTAPVMAGIHGAGLSNMLFMPDGGAVLEFSGVPLADPLFARDALVLGFDFCLAQSQMTDAGPMADLQTADRFLDHLTDRGLLRSQGRGGRFRSARRLLGVAGKKKAAFATHKKPPDAKQSRSSGPPPSCS